MATTKASFGVIDDVIDDDTMATASATTLATSESIKAYIDTQIAANAKLYDYTYTTVTAHIAATSVTAIPIDNTIPQNTEGYEWVTHAHTPASASNILKIVATCNIGETTNTSDSVIQAIFKNSDVGALSASTSPQVGTAAGIGQIVTEHTMVAGDTSPITFKVRTSLNSGTTIEINGKSGGRIFGGVLISKIEVFEYLP
jgi:hypothetical protein